MKFGFRIPSLKKRLAARVSVKRVIRHQLGLKAPRGFGWLTNPKRALYNRVYNRTSKGCLLHLMSVITLICLCIFFVACSGNQESSAVYVKPSVDKNGHYRKGHVRMKTSSKPDAFKHRNQSRYYYQTRGKYRKH